jgi:hypothetical protein
MTFDPNWRGRAKARLEAYFRRKSFPRLTLSLLLLVTGLAGFLVSYGLLLAGVDHMWLRYPVAVVVSYAALLGLIGVWVEVERRRFDAAEADVDQEVATDAQPTRWSEVGDGSWFDLLDFADADVFDCDEGCLPAILGLVVIALGAVLVSTIAAAPALIAEVFLDAFLVAVLYRRLRVAQKEHWLGTALRKTWFAAIVTAGALALGGWTLEQMAPGARSIGKAVEQLRHGAKPPSEPALERE